MNNSNREPNHIDFLSWIRKDPMAYRDFYHEYLLPLILELEQEDYFGTEGFDKRLK